MDGKNNDSLQVVSLKRRGFLRRFLNKDPRRLGKKDVRVVAIVLVAIGLIGAGGYGYYQHWKGVKADKKLYAEAALYVRQPSESVKLKKVVNKIESQPGYMNDPNFVFPIAMYYVNTGNLNEAEKYYKQFQSTYDAKKGLDNEYKNTKVDASILEKSIGYLRTQIKELHKNVTTF